MTVRARSDMARHSESESPHTFSIAAAKDSGSSGGTRTPPPPESNSGAAPAGVAITGVRHAMASRIGKPNPSRRLGHSQASHRA